MNKSHKIELLSPAGSMDALKQAIHNGADAVYLGGTHFGARAFANNFDNSQLKSAVDYAHLYGAKIYITVNTLVYENEISSFKEYIHFLVNIGVDALIMQDIGMAHWAVNTFDIPIHSSTQMHNYSQSNVEYLKSNGFDRAVLARETHIDDIAQSSKTMDTEVFVHGALCISYSGQCLFSAMEHGRSGNRGKCAQACRMKYSLYADDELLVENKHLLSPKDLALLEDIDKIIEAGAASIKLEGRMKSPEYVGFITKTYRNIIDNYYANKNAKVNASDIDTLKRLFNRGFTKGYAFGLNKKTLMSTDRPNHAGVHIGDVISTSKEYITVKLHKTLRQGDGVKFDRADEGFVCNKIYLNGRLANKGEAGQSIQLDNKFNLRDIDKLLLTKDITLIKELGSYEQKKIPIEITGEFHIDKPSTIVLKDIDGNTVSMEGAAPEPSKNAPLSIESISANLCKLGDSAYAAKNINIVMDENIFLSKGNINKLRRDAVELLNTIRTQPVEYKVETHNTQYSAPLPHPVYFSCSVSNNAQLEKALEYNIDRIYVKDFELYSKYKAENKNAYYFISGLSGNTEQYQNERLVIRDTGGMQYAMNNDVIADYMLNITNSQSLAHLNISNVKSACLSVELDDDNIQELCTNYSKAYGNLPNAEVLVYGRVQLMATQHCMLEGNIECGKCKTSTIQLKDIHGNAFPVLVDDKCSNYIYAKEPINRLERVQYLKSLGVNGFRLDFTVESTEEIEIILNKIAKNSK